MAGLAEKAHIDSPSAAVDQSRSNGRSMVERLRRVMVCSPRTAGWDKADRAERWRELGFLHAPSFNEARRQHDLLCEELVRADVEIIELPAADDLSLDAVYAHDASLPTDYGLIALRPGKENRIAEGKHHAAFCQDLGVGRLGEITDPATAEAGDMVWIDPKTLLAGRGYRTNLAGISQLQNLLGPKGISVVSAPLPHGQGPSTCLHLMSLMSLLDDNTALVDLPYLAVETVEVLQHHDYEFIEIDYSERDTLACNVLALGDNRLLAIAENEKTNARLRASGFDVRTFPGSELCINGGGGPTCLTRPLLRGEL